MTHRWSLFVVRCLFTACPRPVSPGYGRWRGEQEKVACVEALNRSDAASADRACKLGLEFTPDDADLWVNLGLVRELQTRNAEAYDCFVKAIHLRPDSYQAFNNLALLDQGRGNFKAAETHFSAALTILPDFNEARLNLGALLVKARRRSEAREAFEVVAHVNPRLTAPHKWLAFLALEDHAPDVAATELEVASRLDADDLEVWSNLGLAYLGLARFADAAAAYRACLSLAPGTVSCQLGLVQANNRSAAMPPDVTPPSRRP